KVAERYGGEAISITDIPGMIETADIIISSTGSRLPIVTRSMIQTALKARRRTPMFLVDLAVPRDIEAATADLSDVYLFTVDDLKSVIDDNLKQREAAAERADEMVTAYVQEYAQYQQSLASVDVIRSVRDDAVAQRDAVLERARRQLEAGKDPAAVLEQSLNTLTNKLLHAPTASLRDAENAADTELLELARRLYGIDRLPPDA
ncbi:MAG: glutamyl-tRNA reductase, partial [Gammaproteobacteria bacterium]|nr:glutamyl-tRNA reductase [Gammaproteobacteria bacterium]